MFFATQQTTEPENFISMRRIVCVCVCICAFKSSLSHTKNEREKTRRRIALTLAILMGNLVVFFGIVSHVVFHFSWVSSSFNKMFVLKNSISHLGINTSHSFIHSQWYAWFFMIIFLFCLFFLEYLHCVRDGWYFSFHLCCSRFLGEPFPQPPFSSMFFIQWILLHAPFLACLIL